MIVVDTNVICYLFLTGPHSAASEQVLLADSQWAAPLLWRSEFLNVLAGTMRREKLTINEASEVMDNAVALMRPNEFAVKSDHVLRLVSNSNCSAYDCELVALAQTLNVPLISADRHLLASFPEFVQSPAVFLGLE